MSQKPASAPSSFSAPFVGRARELAELASALEAMLGGSSYAVLVGGDPGIGKTRLAAELATTAEARGCRVLWGRCYEWEGAPAYWPWVQVLREAAGDGDAGALRAAFGPGANDAAQILPELRDEADGQPAAPERAPEQARFSLFNSVATFLARLAGEQPLLIVIDDLHWADTPSLLLFQFIIQQTRGDRLLLLATYRDSDVDRSHQLTKTLAALAREQNSRRLELRGLPLDDISRFVAAVSGQERPAALVDAVYRETEGNPFFVSEVMRLLAIDGDARNVPGTGGWRLRVPETVRDAIGRRLDRLSPACNELLAIASVIGREFDLRMLIRGSASAPEQILDALDEAIAARLVEERDAAGRYRFSHALVQDTLYDSLTTTRRMRLHQQVGEAIEQIHVPSLAPYYPELAYHFASAAPLGAGERAIDYAFRAGDQSMSQFAWESAIDQYQRAVRAFDFVARPDPVRQCEVLLALGDAQHRADRSNHGSPAARESFLRAAELARATGSGEQLARAALGFSEPNPFASPGAWERVTLLEEARSLLGPADSSLRSRLLARLAIELDGAELAANPLLRTAPDSHVRRLIDEAVAIARKIDDDSTLAFALRARLITGATAANLDERIALSREIIAVAGGCGDADLLSWGHLFLFWNLAETGDADLERQGFQAYLDVVQRLHSPFLEDWGLATMYAQYAWRAGRLDEADAWTARATDDGLYMQFPDLLLLLRREQGRPLEVEESVRALTESFPSHIEMSGPITRLVLELELGRPDAQEIFEWIARDRFIHVPMDECWLYLMASLAEACTTLDAREHAEPLYDLLLPYAPRNVAFLQWWVALGPMARFLGLLATTLRRWDAAERHFSDAIAMSRRIGEPPFEAYAQFGYADMLIRRDAPGGRDRARDLLDQALQTARECGMVRLERLALQLLATLDRQHAQDPDRLGLSAREAEVLRLIVAGRTDREIAEALFVSRRTVTTHVSSILNKLGATSRTEAAALAVRRELA